MGRAVFWLVLGLVIAVIVIDRYQPGTIDRVITTVRALIDSHEPGTADRIINNTKAVIDSAGPGTADRLADETKRVVGQMQQKLPNPSVPITAPAARTNETATVNAPDNNLNLRAGPNANTPVLMVLPQGSQVEIVESFDNGWKKVRVVGLTGGDVTLDDFKTGYVNGKYLVSDNIIR